MVEIVLDGLGPAIDEGTIQNWFFEEGDIISEGNDLVELSTEEGLLTIQAPVSGVLAEVYYDEGELVAKGEILCTIDEGESDEDSEEEEAEEAEESKEDKDDDEDDEDDEKAEEDDEVL